MHTVKRYKPVWRTKWKKTKEQTLYINTMWYSLGKESLTPKFRLELLTFAVSSSRLHRLSQENPYVHDNVIIPTSLFSAISVSLWMPVPMRQYHVILIHPSELVYYLISRFERQALTFKRHVLLLTLIPVEYTRSVEYSFLLHNYFYLGCMSTTLIEKIYSINVDLIYRSNKFELFLLNWLVQSL